MTSLCYRGCVAIVYSRYSLTSAFTLAWKVQQEHVFKHALGHPAWLH